MDINKEIAIIDCSALAHRVKYTLPNLEAEFMPTGVIFGFMLKVLEISKRFKTNQFVFAFDSDKRKYRRKKIYSGYKVPDKPKELTEENIYLNNLCYNQLDILRKEFLPKIGFKNIYIEKGYEADDIIANIVMNNNGKFIIYSGDEDMYQLLNYAKIYKPNKKIYTKIKFLEEYRINPSKWYKVKAIAGCKSDCIPGVQGVGEKKAIQFLKKEGTTNMRNKILSHKKMIKRNIKLVKLPFGKMKPIYLEKGEILNLGNFIDICNNYNFQSFLKMDQLIIWEDNLDLNRKIITECPF